MEQAVITIKDKFKILSTIIERKISKFYVWWIFVLFLSGPASVPIAQELKFTETPESTNLRSKLKHLKPVLPY